MCCPLKISGLARDKPCNFAEGDDRPGKGDRTDGRTHRHFDQAAGMDLPTVPMP